MSATKLISDLLSSSPNRPQPSGRVGNASRMGDDFRNMLAKSREAAQRPQKEPPSARAEEPKKPSEMRRREESRPAERPDRQDDRHIDHHSGHRQEARKAGSEREQPAAEADQAKPDAAKSREEPAEGEVAETKSAVKTDEISKSPVEAAAVTAIVAAPLQGQATLAGALLADGSTVASQVNAEANVSVAADAALSVESAALAAAAVAGAPQATSPSSQTAVVTAPEGEADLKATTAAADAVVAKPTVAALANEAVKASDDSPAKSDAKASVEALKAMLPDAKNVDAKNVDAKNVDGKNVDAKTVEAQQTAEGSAKAAAKSEAQQATSNAVKELAASVEQPKAQNSTLQGIVAPQAVSQTADLSPTAAPKAQDPAQAMARADAPVPLQAVAVEIGMRAMRGAKEFAIRLDPEDLGRVDIKLEISEKGEVQAKLVVERVETLQLLQRDARTLERAFDQAGLKTNPDGLQFTLRDPGQQGRGGEQDQPKAQGRNGLDKDIGMIDEIALRPAIYQTAATSGLDIRI